ncbi:MAG: hypothetical protein IPL83_03835 [Bdellovibrionales bacterium]|nr:hypothetical protein [Bdellovibrionales bacterium]
MSSILKKNSHLKESWNEFTIALFLLAVMAGQSCSTGELVISTTPPQADIRARTGSGQNYESIGKSPLRISGKELSGRLGGDGPIQIEISKEGFAQKEIIVSESPRNFDINFSIELKEPSKDQDESRPINQTVDSLFEVQRLVKVGRLEDALEMIKLLQASQPNIAAVHEMQGGIFFIQKDIPKALDAYTKAVRLNPENSETLNMKRYLENLTKTNEANTSNSIE